MLKCSAATRIPLASNPIHPHDKMAANKLFIPFLIKKELNCLAEDFITQWQSTDDRADKRQNVMQSALNWLREKDYTDNEEFDMLTEKL